MRQINYDMSWQFIMDTTEVDQHSKVTEIAVGFPAAVCKKALSERCRPVVYLSGNCIGIA